jgi:NADP-dependent 3-hydroxy acid dehydrogenase YdfG
MSTEKKVAVITGASSGIGAGILQAFKDRNYRVVATSRSIMPVADEDVVTVQGDVAARDTAERVFKAAFERFGRVDTLVNNAGLFMARPFVLYSQADYAILTGTHVAGFFHMTQCALELMSKQERGHVVTITTSLVDPTDEQCPIRPDLSHKRGTQCGNQGARHRVRKDRNTRERRIAGNM